MYTARGGYKQPIPTTATGSGATTRTQVDRGMMYLRLGAGGRYTRVAAVIFVLAATHTVPATGRHEQLGGRYSASCSKQYQKNGIW